METEFPGYPAENLTVRCLSFPSFYLCDLTVACATSIAQGLLRKPTLIASGLNQSP